MSNKKMKAKNIQVTIVVEVDIFQVVLTISWLTTVDYENVCCKVLTVNILPLVSVIVPGLNPIVNEFSFIEIISYGIELSISGLEIILLF